MSAPAHNCVHNDTSQSMYFLPLTSHSIYGMFLRTIELLHYLRSCANTQRHNDEYIQTFITHYPCFGLFDLYIQDKVTLVYKIFCYDNYTEDSKFIFCQHDKVIVQVQVC